MSTWTAATKQLSLTYHRVATSCGHSFYMDDDIYTSALATGRTFWCPVCGNPQCYTKSDLTEAKREAKLARERAERAERRSAELREEAASDRRRGAAARGQVTKLKNRIAAGECPACDQHFHDLENHMASEHPDYTEGDPR